jgi:hypothetical protein
MLKVLSVSVMLPYFCCFPLHGIFTVEGILYGYKNTMAA